jgi:integrase
MEPDSSLDQPLDPLTPHGATPAASAHPRLSPSPVEGLSQSSYAFYMRTARQLVARIEREMGFSWTDDPIAFVQRVIQERDRVRASSWRIMRSSMLLFLRQNGAPVEATDLLKATRGTAGPRNPGLRKRKKKSLPDAVMQTLQETLSDPARYGLRSTPVDTLLARWLEANVVLGLRPAEWSDLKVSDGPKGTLKGTLLVSLSNAKNTHGRATGNYRAILLDGEAASAVRAAVEERDLLLDFGLSWDELVRRMRRRLYAVRLAAGGLQNVGLYSTRHQSVANMKSAAALLQDIAQTFGHASVKTAQRHYGKTISGSGYSPVIVAAAGPTREAAEALCLAAAKQMRAEQRSPQDTPQSTPQRSHPS